MRRKAPCRWGAFWLPSHLGVMCSTRVQQTIRDSLLFALGDPGATLPTQRHYAQEFDDEVLMQHV
ncbi:MAG: hypothetical protein R3C56_05235 [Pirellulaceae bacterium]